MTPKMNVIEALQAHNTHIPPFYGSLDFVRDNPAEPVPEETSTHFEPIKRT